MYVSFGDGWFWFVIRWGGFGVLTARKQVWGSIIRHTDYHVSFGFFRIGFGTSEQLQPIMTYRAGDELL